MINEPMQILQQLDGDDQDCKHGQLARICEICKKDELIDKLEDWNARVSVCKDHTAEVIDGPCLVCRIAALESQLAEARSLLTEAAETLEDVEEAEWTRALRELRDKLRRAIDAAREED